ncbi:MAG TPA: LysR family transcriptional regulator [Phycisphaerales bacterium]|nr:LysR family transcriptional regulator [Phycisphaerales bacterium]
MHIETLKVFCDICELGSFSKTAEKNLLSQSAVSQQLAQLEVAHKCQLIDRKKRPIELTKEGELLYRTAKEMIERYDQFRTELNAMARPEKNRVNVGAIFSIGMHTLPAYVKRFMVEHPDINVHIEYLSAAVIYERVLLGDIDVGLVAVPKRDKRLDVYEFEDEKLVVACGTRHPLAHKPQIDIHQLQFERFISFEKDVPTRAWIDGILGRYNVVVRSVMEFDNIETVKRAVEINAGVSLLPESAILQEVAAGALVGVPLANENFVRPTGIIVRKGKVIGPAVRYFIDLVAKTGRD